MPASSLIHLTGPSTSVVLRQGGTLPEILYWGSRLDGASLENLETALDRPVSNARLDINAPLSLCPEHNLGLFSTPGLEGCRAGGKDWAPRFVPKSCQHDGQSLLITATDAVAELQLTIELQLDTQTEVLQHRLTLTNLGASPYQLQRLGLTLPLPCRAQELLRLRGRWCQEFQSERVDWRTHNYLQENRRGRTSHEYFPGLIAGPRHFGEDHGEIYGIHLGWSGNHRIQAAVKSDGRRFLQAEELLQAGEIELDPGQSYPTPWLYAAYSAAGLNGLSRRFHRFVRERILTWPEPAKPRPVHLNTWEGIYFEHDPAYIMQMASRAAEMGVERFIIDDGWFVGRDGERAALGDWYLDTTKYPGGLEPVIGHIKQLGMEFGLWFEPEMVNPDSDLYRAHPEWVLGQAAYPQPTGRYQYVLDLQNQAVFDYLLERLDSLLGQYDIRYIKWDMNRELVQPAHLGRAAVHGQTLAVYRLVDTIRERHPGVEIESCSSGGGRIDFEILKRTHRFWASDCNDALERQTIQRGMSYFFPPEVMGAHIGPDHSHTTSRQHSIAFRGLTALFGHMGVELDPVKATAEERADFARYIRLHQQLRPLLHSGNTVRFECDDPGHQQAYGVIAADRSQAVVLIAQLAMPSFSLPGTLLIPGLAGDRRYRVEVLDRPQQTAHLMKKLPVWLTESFDVTGEQLSKIGLQLPVMDPESALLLKLTQA